MDIMKMLLKPPTSILQEMYKKKPKPVYELVLDATKTAQPLFTYRVTCGEESATGSGRRKKTAKQEAAMAMLRKLEIANSSPENYTKTENQNSPEEEEALQPFLENACNGNELIQNLLPVQRLMIKKIYKKNEEDVKCAKPSKSNSGHIKKLLVKVRQELASAEEINFLLKEQLKTANSDLKPFVVDLKQHKNVMLKLSKSKLENDTVFTKLIDSLNATHVLTTTMRKHWNEIAKMSDNIVDMERRLEVGEENFNTERNNFKKIISGWEKKERLLKNQMMRLENKLSIQKAMGRDYNRQ